MKTKTLTLFLVFLSQTIPAQIKSINNQEIQILYGTGIQKNINTKQVLVSYAKYFERENIRSIMLGYIIDFEYLDEIKKNNVILFGFGGGLKQVYDLESMKLVLDSYISMNYIDRKKIGNRNLGENFIFSDNLKVGLEFGNSILPGLSIFYQFRHISNAGIYHENMGYNSQYIFVSLNLKYL